MAENFIETGVQLPPGSVIVFTKIEDEKGCRNETLLSRTGNLWFIPDGSMYVYYAPTHWRPATKKELERERADIAEKARAENAMSIRLLNRLDTAIVEAEHDPND